MWTFQVSMELANKKKKVILKLLKSEFSTYAFSYVISYKHEKHRALAQPKWSRDNLSMSNSACVIVTTVTSNAVEIRFAAWNKHVVFDRHPR